MRGLTFLKGATAGGVGATAVVAATAAFAGTGIGGVFNLGQTNTVGHTSTLTGATSSAPELQVTNTSTTGAATGLAISTAAGKAPISVNSSTMSPKLNAQYVGGFQANSLGRVGLASTRSLLGLSATDTQATLTITAPKQGFVRLDGAITAYDGFSSSFCGDCAVYVRVHDVSANADSPMSYAEGGAATHATSMVIPVNWVFPVAAGSHSYTLTTAQTIVSGGGFGFYNPVLTAQYVPFGSTGSATTLSASTKAAQTTARRVALGRAAAGAR